jgi:tetratricopeptide (TPR) repeat protein
MKKIVFLFLVIFSSDISGQILERKRLVGQDLSFQNAHYSEGLRKFQFDDYLGAINELNKGVKEMPNQSSIYTLRADVKSKLQDYRGAIQDYDKSLELKPDGYTYHRRGLAKFELNKINQAMEDFNLAIEVYKLEISNNSQSDFEKDQISDIYVDRGNHFFHSSQYEEAINEYSLAIQYYENSLAYFNRGISYVLTNKLDLGCLDFSKAGELGLEEAYTEIKKSCN